MFVDCSALLRDILPTGKLSPNMKSHRGIIYQGGLKTLFFLLQVKDVAIRRQAATALRDLAANPAHKLKYSEEGGLRAMIALAREKDIELQCLAVASLRHLSLDDLLKRTMVEEGALAPVLRCATVEHCEDLQCQCAGVLANLSENMENQISIVEEGGVGPLVGLGLVRNDEVQQDVARALANLSSNEENHATIYKQRGLHCLIGLTKSDVDITQRYAAMGLRFLASNAEIRVHIIREHLLQVRRLRPLRLCFTPLLSHSRLRCASFTHTPPCIHPFTAVHRAGPKFDFGLPAHGRCCVFELLVERGEQDEACPRRRPCTGKRRLPCCSGRAEPRSCNTSQHFTYSCSFSCFLRWRLRRF